MKFDETVECPACEGVGLREVSLGYGIGPERLEEATCMETCESCDGRRKVTLEDIILDDELVECYGGASEVLALIRDAINGKVAA